MLQNIRDNSQGWIAKTIIGLIIVLLALTGFEAILNGVGNQQTAAEVNGEEISLSELSLAVEMQRRQLAQQFGRDFDTSLIDDNLLRNAALSDLIDRRLLVQAAREADFANSRKTAVSARPASIRSSVRWAMVDCSSVRCSKKKCSLASCRPPWLAAAS